MFVKKEKKRFLCRILCDLTGATTDLFLNIHSDFDGREGRNNRYYCVRLKASETEGVVSCIEVEIWQVNRGRVKVEGKS